AAAESVNAAAVYARARGQQLQRDLTQLAHPGSAVKSQTAAVSTAERSGERRCCGQASCSATASIAHNAGSRVAWQRVGRQRVRVMASFDNRARCRDAQHDGQRHGIAAAHTGQPAQLQAAAHGRGRERESAGQH
ncbi:hypothetical protein Dimus_022744, partial [Dionaea muscipula]